MEGRNETNSQRMEEEKIKKFILILILALSLLSVPVLTSPVHAFSCPTSSAPHKIDGCVVNSDTGNPVSGLVVVIITCGRFQSTAYVTTDSNGYFSFQGNNLPICISGSSAYPVSVNGVTPITWVNGCYPLPSPCDVVGVTAYDPTWGQWAGDVQTYGNGYGSVIINLTPARIVMVAAAAMYSNTQFTTLHFSMSQSSDVTIGVSASIGGASSVQAGYSYNFGVTSTNSFDEPPLHSDHFGYPYYAIGYYCAGSTSESYYGWTCSRGLQTAGVTAPVPGYHWQPYYNGEYLNPNLLPAGSYLDCTIIASAASFGPSSTHTKGYSSSLGFTSGATFFGITASFSYTTTYSSTTSDTTGVTISYTNGPNLTFRYYPATGTCQNPIFGSELHVWDMSPPPDYSMFATPSSLSPQTGFSWSRSTTITVQASWGFALPVGLSASSDDPNLQLSLTPTSVNPMGGTASSTLTVTDPVASDSGSHTITVIGQGGGLWRSVAIPLSIVAPISINDHQGSPSSTTITFSGFPALTGTVSFSSTVAGGPPGTCPGPNCPSVVFSPAIATISPQGWATSTLTVTAGLSTPCAPYPQTAMTYSITVTGTSGGVSLQAVVYVTVFHAGDANGDGFVNGIDFGLVGAAFGTTRGQPGYNPYADLNNDGVINGLDFGIVGANFGRAC